MLRDRKPLDGSSLAAILLTFFAICLASQSEAVAQLNVAVEANPDPAGPQQMLFVRITVSNSTNAASGAIRVEMEYPPGLVSLLDAAISDGGDCTNLGDGVRCNAGEIMFWELDPLGPGQGKTLSFPPFVSSDAEAGTLIQFKVDVFEDDVAVDSANEIVEVVEETPLDLSVDADQDPVPSGGLLTYSLLLSNQGASSVRSSELRFPIPNGTQLVSADGGGVEEAGEVLWNLGTIFSGQSRRLEVTVDVNDNIVAGSLLEIGQAVLSAELEFVVIQARARAVTRVGSVSSLILSLEANPDPLRQGELLQTRLTVSNPSASLVTGVVIQLRYPALLAGLLDAAISDGGDCTNLGDGVRCNTQEILTWNIGTLGPGRGTTVFLTPLATNAALDGNLVRLRARAVADSVAEQWERRTIAIKDDGALNLAVDPSQDPARSGSQVTLAFSVANRGQAAVRETSLRFPMPDGVALISASDGGSAVGTDVVWNLGTLGAGKGRKLEAIVEVDPGLAAGDQIETKPSTLIGEVDLVTQESRTTAGFRIEELPALSLAIEPNPDPVRPNEYLETRLTVANRSREPLTGVILELQYPSYLNGLLDAAISDEGDCTNLGDAVRCNEQEVLIWNLGTLGSGGGRTVTLPPVTRQGIVGGTLIPVRARAFADSSRIVWERRSVIVEEDSPLNLRIDADINPVSANQFLTYSLTYGNRSGSQLQDTRLSLPLPPQTRLVSATGPAALEDGEVVWELGILTPGEGGRLQATVQIDDDVAEGLILESETGRFTAAGDLQTVEARHNPAIRTEGDVGLAIAVSPGEEAFQARDTVPVEVTVTNTSNSILTGVTARLFYPPLLNGLLDAQVSDDGDCTNLGDGVRCNAFETVVWDIGNLAPGTALQVSLPPEINAGAAGGNILRFLASAADDGSRRVFRSFSPYIGVLNGDANGDGEVNIADLVAAMDQILSGQFGPGPDCSGDGDVEIQDAQCILSLIRD